MWKVSKSYYAMFTIKALLMTRLECIQFRVQNTATLDTILGWGS